jgi:hypothetical protein
MWILIFKRHNWRRVIFPPLAKRVKRGRRRKKKKSGETQHIYLSTARQDKEVLTTV